MNQKKHQISFLIALLITLLVPHVQAANQLPFSLAQSADSAYRAGNYHQAASLYEEVITNGYTSASLHYNLGNAYYRLDQYGPAILNYERALRLKPSMKDAKENLALTNSKTTDRIAQLPQFMVVKWYNHIAQSLRPTDWRIIWLILMAAIVACFVVLRLGSTLSIRKTSLIIGIILLVLFLATSLLWHTSATHFNSHQEAIVMQQAIAVKSSPDAHSVDKLLLHEGTKVHIDESLTGWYKITIADGTSGWCETSSVERI